LPWCFTLALLVLGLSGLAAGAEAETPIQQVETDETIGSLGNVPESDLYEFNDFPLEQSIVLPDWFKLSFLELKNDLKDAAEAGKTGLIVYFGQKDCAYCKAHLEHNWEDMYIVAYTRKHFDVVAIDVRGDRPVSDLKGKVFRTEKAFAIANKANFTPTLLFYDTEGHEALRLSGYHPPYQFTAALEYVVDGYYKKEPFKNYLARADSFSEYGNDELNHSSIFAQPPYALDRTVFPSQMPLAVFFEKPRCFACDVLHSGPMSNTTILQSMEQLEAVQLDITQPTPVLTPDGQRLTAQSWAEQLGIYYTPTLIFFDERGREIIRVDSVVGFYRLNNVLHYVLTKGYLKTPNFQLWRQQHQR
jgi:thioredoxin-related protein